MTPAAGEARTRALTRLSAALAARADDVLEARLREVAEGGAASPTEVEEALLQSYLFLGYPAALDALAVWRRVSGSAPSAASAGDPDAGDWGAWERRGAEVCRVVYGGQYDDLRANVRALHPDLERWMVVEGYGKVLGRPGLALAERELCIVATLAVQNAPRQLFSHLRGALHAGATESAIDGALLDAAELSDADAAAVARETWRAVRERRRSGGRHP